MLYVFLFILGLSFGSFLNVLAKRYTPDKRLFRKEIFFSRSKCPYCQKTLCWYELIPLISFLIQKGKCRSCKERLSWQYPIIELLSGLIFVITPFFFNFQPLLSLIWVFIFLTLVLVSIIDLSHFSIPDELIWFLAFLALIFVFFKQDSFGFAETSFLGYYGRIFYFENVWLNHIIGALIAGLFFWLIIYFSKERAMGYGDLKLGLVLGFILGSPDIILALTLCFILGGFLASILILLKKKKMKDFLAFAPFFNLGFFLTVFFGFEIINGYLRFFGAI